MWLRLIDLSHEGLVVVLDFKYMLKERLPVLRSDP